MVPGACLINVMDEKTALKILSLQPEDSFESARRAYRKLAKQFHPDLAGPSPEAQVSAEMKMKEINQAFRLIAPILRNKKTAQARPVSPPEKTSQTQTKQPDGSAADQTGTRGPGSTIRSWFSSFRKKTGGFSARGSKTKFSSAPGRKKATPKRGEKAASFKSVLDQVHSGPVRNGSGARKTGKRPVRQPGIYSDSFQNYMALKKKIRAGRKRRGRSISVGRVEKISAVRPVHRIDP